MVTRIALCSAWLVGSGCALSHAGGPAGDDDIRAVPASLRCEGALKSDFHDEIIAAGEGAIVPLTSFQLLGGTVRDRVELDVERFVGPGADGEDVRCFEVSGTGPLCSSLLHVFVYGERGPLSDPALQLAHRVDEIADDVVFSVWRRGSTALTYAGVVRGCTLGFAIVLE